MCRSHTEKICRSYLRPKQTPSVKAGDFLCSRLPRLLSLMKSNKIMKTRSIHSFIFFTAYSIEGHGEAGAYLQQSTGGKRDTPWTGRQSIAGQHRDTQDKQPCTHSVTPNGNLERPINVTVIFLD
ncbi:hypothetical protein CHARACLAT_007408 [Characodon lateralis]|uniref:Uncharacterized protein n=1 Tax=Characodon lateralis TaxID=208331 RepID=A0ABU7EIW0_9TELE|nr:hypothetical protein [Characodon lateralis]